MLRPYEEQLGAVRVGVLDGVLIEVLVDGVAAEMASAGRVSLDRPGALHPGAFIDLMDVEIAEAAAAGPQETDRPLDLVEQLADAFRLRTGQRTC